MIHGLDIVISYTWGIEHILAQQDKKRLEALQPFLLQAIIGAILNS